MLNSPIVNLVILLSFTYFIGSLLVSTINEAIAGTLKLRQKQLKKALAQLFLDDPQWTAYIHGKFQDSAFIQSLKKTKSSFPAYIPSKNFALAVLGECSFDKLDQDSQSMIAAIDGADCLPAKIKEVIKSFIQGGITRIDALEAALEAFYNNAMDRVSGWYKRKIKMITFILGFGMAAAMNIDTIKIVADGLSNKDQLVKSADAIALQVGNVNKDGNMRVSANNNTILVSDTTQIVPETDTTVPNYKAVRQRVKNVVLAYNQTTAFEMGYASQAALQLEWLSTTDTDHPWKSMHWWILWKKILGLIITAFALQLGSGYWFDLLGKVVNLRSTGVKPEKTQPSDTKDSSDS